MNHVPDAALAAIDALGMAVLRGDDATVSERLRSDLRVRIVAASSDETARCVFEADHTTAPDTLRDRGSFVTTIVDGIDDRLRSWGIEPPSAYEHTETVDGVHRYEGALRLP